MRKSNSEVINYLQEFVNRNEVNILENNGLSITCTYKSDFTNVKDYRRVKAYLRRNGFISSGTGLHTRPTDSTKDGVTYNNAQRLREMLTFYEQNPKETPEQLKQLLNQ